MSLHLLVIENFLAVISSLLCGNFFAFFHCLFLILIPKYFLLNTMANRIVNFHFRLFIVTEAN